MLSLALLVCVWCSVCLWLKYARVKSTSIMLPPAAPGGLPLIGPSYQLLKNYSTLWDYFRYIAEDCVKQGGVTYLTLRSDSYYLITDPEDALTAANACLKKHFAYDLVKPWMGDGILISSGDIWKRHRKLIIPAFTLPVVYGFLDVFNSQAKKLASSMEPLVGKGPFDHSSYLKDNALETFCIGTLGIDPIDNVKFTRKYMDSIYEMFNLAVMRAIKFWLLNDFIYWLVGLKKKEDELVNTLHTMVDKVLQEKKVAMNNAALNQHNIVSNTTGIKYKPFLDLLLELSKNGTLSDKEIREETDVITAAGFETTSNNLMYTLLVLGAYPDIQEKVYQEILEVVGADRDVEKDDVSKLVYTNAVLMECLRLFPTVPLMIRCVGEDVQLKKYTMYAGSYCVIAPLMTHLDPTWGPDSDKFRPERWLYGDLRNNKEFAAFGLGKRSCIGRIYAMVSMKVTLAHFLRRYRLTADISKLKLKFEYILKAACGNEISIERRT